MSTGFYELEVERLKRELSESKARVKTLEEQVKVLDNCLVNKLAFVKTLKDALRQYSTYLESGREADLNRFFIMHERALAAKEPKC